jgi:hypothetical protein
MALAGVAAFGQSVWVSNSSNDRFSWAMVRVSGGGKANVGDLAGVHIGEVDHDDLFVAKAGKVYEITDPAVYKQVDEANKPTDKAREERTKVKSHMREVQGEARAEERERRALERDKQRVERNLERENADRADLQKQIADLDRQISDLEKKASTFERRLEEENKKFESATKKLNAARDERMKKLEAIFDSAIAKGIAKPYR